MKKNDDSHHLLGINLFSGTLNSLLITLVDQVKQGKKPLVVFTPNPEQFIQARHNPEFMKTLEQADVRVPDGVGLIWADRILAKSSDGQAAGSSNITERISGIDLVTSLLDQAAGDTWPVVVLGGRGYESLPKGVTWIPGYQTISTPTALEEKEVAKQLSSIRPKIVFVALGAPWQEQWILDHLDLLNSSGVKLAMVVGGAFDVITGKLPRAPQVIQRFGLEWAYRLWREPWRWRRQLRLVEFVWLVILTKLGFSSPSRT